MSFCIFVLVSLGIQISVNLFFQRSLLPCDLSGLLTWSEPNFSPFLPHVCCIFFIEIDTFKQSCLNLEFFLKKIVVTMMKTKTVWYKLYLLDKENVNRTMGPIVPCLRNMHDILLSYITNMEASSERFLYKMSL